MRAELAAAPPVLAGALVLLLFAGCGEGGSPTSVVGRYETAIFSRDGDKLCATFAPKLREVLAEQASEQAGPGSTSRPRFDCGAFYHVLIGYPHENTDRQFVAGKLLSVGSPHEVTRGGIVYVKVRAKVVIEFTYTGYSTSTSYSSRPGDKGSATIADIVWLSKGNGGKWGVVKPSLALLAASSPDEVFDTYMVVHASAPPPDPDYTMNRTERTAWEAADYRASFRRNVKHAPLRCGGKSVSIRDPLHDAVDYATGSFHPAAAPGANDVARVLVQGAGRRMCVTVAFRKKPAEHVRIVFSAHATHAFFPGYIVEVDPSLGVRGGGMTIGYRYFRGGMKLIQKEVGDVAVYGRTVAFVADAGATVPPDLRWSILSTTPSGTDQVPNHRQGEYAEIQQSNGHVLKTN